MQVHGKTNISHLKGHFAMQPQDSGFSGADRIRKIVWCLRNFSRLDEAEIKFAPIHEGIDNNF